MKFKFSSALIGFFAIIIFGLIALQWTSHEWLLSSANSLVKDGEASSHSKSMLDNIKFNSLFAVVFFTLLLIATIYKKDSIPVYIKDFSPFIKSKGISILKTFKTYQSTTNLVLAVLIVIGSFARFMLLNDAITYDEAFSVNQYSTTSFVNILSNYNYPNNHILYNLINRIVIPFIGTSELSIRLPAFLFGILCLPSLIILGQLLFKSEKKSLILVSLFAFSPLLIEYSAMARGYSLVWFLIIWALIFILKLQSTRDKRYFTLIVLCLSLSFWTIPVSLIPFLVLLLITYRKIGTVDSLKLAVTTIIATSILYLPVLVIYGGKLPEIIKLGEESSFQRLFDYHITHCLYDLYYNFIMTKPILFSGFTLIFIAALLKFRKSQIAWYGYILIAIIAAVIFQKNIPPARVWSTILLFIYIPFASVLGEIFYKAKGILIYFIVPLLLIVQLVVFKKSTFIMNDFRYESAETIVSMVSEPTAIICEFPMEAPLEYYWKAYLRDFNQFNVLDDHLLIVISLKHQQTLNEVCEKWKIYPSRLDLFYQDEEVEVYQLKQVLDSNFIKFEF